MQGDPGSDLGNAGASQDCRKTKPTDDVAADGVSVPPVGALPPVHAVGLQARQTRHTLLGTVLLDARCFLQHTQTLALPLNTRIKSLLFRRSLSRSAIAVHTRRCCQYTHLFSSKMQVLARPGTVPPFSRLSASFAVLHTVGSTEEVQ